ncbi:MAG: YceD family protein [Tumebacillaceae bacterium]
MKLRWRDLRERSEGVNLQESVELPNLVKENRQLVAAKPIQADLHGIEASGVGIVQGNLTTQATYRCSRCLCDFSEELHVPFDESFLQVDKVPGDQEGDEEERIPVVGDTIDLTPYLEQAVNLALPYSPVCREDCAGLCPECGVNRNEVTCSCNTERIDPRLADLAKFFETE